MKLLCPICQQELTLKEKSYLCALNHSFDLSKSGYLNLHIKQSKKTSGDDKIMIEARTSFLSKGFYLPLKEKLNQLIKECQPQTLVDCACGEGYYTKDFPCPDILGVDLSKEAILYASKQDKKNQYCISSIFNLPLSSNSVDCITVLFAPLASEEIQRVLKKNGHLFVVSVGEDHLFELKEAVYDCPYRNPKAELEIDLKLQKTSIVKEIISLSSSEDIQNLFKMTPYYYKTSSSDKEKLKNLSSLSTTIHFVISHYSNR